MDRIDLGDSTGCTDMDMGIKGRKPTEKLQKKIQEIGPKKIIIILVVVGVLFMVFPINHKETAVPAMALQEEVNTTDTLETRMAEILSCVSGAGEVRVMLTVMDYGETEFQTDTEEYQNGEQWETKTETVFGRDSSSPIIRKKTEPSFLGAVVLCQGAENDRVRYDITNAVCRLTGLGSDKIAVLKMKQ